MCYLFIYFCLKASLAFGGHRSNKDDNHRVHVGLYKIDFNDMHMRIFCSCIWSPRKIYLYCEGKLSVYLRNDIGFFFFSSLNNYILLRLQFIILTQFHFFPIFKWQNVEKDKTCKWPFFRVKPHLYPSYFTMISI